MTSDPALPIARAEPVKLAYAAPSLRRRAADGAVTAFTVVAVAAVLGAGSVAWALLLQQH